MNATSVLLPVKHHGVWGSITMKQEELATIAVYHSVRKEETYSLVLVTEVPSKNKELCSYVLAVSYTDVSSTRITGVDVLTCVGKKQGYDVWTGTVRTFHSPFYTWRVLKQKEN